MFFWLFRSIKSPVLKLNPATYGAMRARDEEKNDGKMCIRDRYNALEGHISNVVVANPKWVRAVKGEKDDNKDAKWIADLFKLGMARSSFIPGKDIRILRELTRYLYKVVGIASSEKNRFQNALVVGNLRADMVFSDRCV